LFKQRASLRERVTVRGEDCPVSGDGVGPCERVTCDGNGWIASFLVTDSSLVAIGKQPGSKSKAIR